MMHIVVGLFFVSLGLWGVFDEWYYVVDCLKGGFSLALVVAGIIAILAGVVGPRSSLEPDEADLEGAQPFEHEE